MLTLEEDEELTAASHWLLPAGNAAGEATLNLTTQSKLIKLLSKCVFDFVLELTEYFCF